MELFWALGLNELVKGPLWEHGAPQGGSTLPTRSLKVKYQHLKDSQKSQLHISLDPSS